MMPKYGGQSVNSVPHLDSVFRTLIQLEHLFIHFKFTLNLLSALRINHIQHMLKFGK